MVSFNYRGTMHNAILKIVILHAMVWSIVYTYDPFADNVLFNINWPGPASDNILLSSDEDVNLNAVVMTTKDNEKYRCIIPDDSNGPHKGGAGLEDGPDELELLTSLFEQTSCSYRIESYWTYELCHGKFLRQYHEEKEMGKKPNMQEYFLGRYPNAKGTNTDASQETPPPVKTESSRKRDIPTKKIDGNDYPYYVVKFDSGTVCDLTGQPRKAELHYVCMPGGRGEIYELKEQASCEYEVVVLTSLLCNHPGYEQKKDVVNKIQCHPLDGAPRRPKSLDNLEHESLQDRYNRKAQADFGAEAAKEQATKTEKYDEIFDGDDGTGFIYDDDDEDDDEEYILLPDEGDEEDDVEEEEDEPENAKWATKDVREDSYISSATDKKVIKEFLLGESCITGGTGWWKHEFCYGKKVIQFHQDKADKNSKTVITLGKWSLAAHMDWLRANPSKKPRRGSQRKSISHFYGHGETCDLTGRPRFVEVKLKCKENPKQPHSMSIYLVEPNSCEYILVVESQLLCSLIDTADENGIIPAPVV